MDSYETLAAFYDSIMGDQRSLAKSVHSMIKKSSADVKTLLELGCGTGSYLAYFSKYCEVSGLDSSSAMLAAAREKVPSAHLYLNDMLSFDFDRKFDCIICMNDSVNHLLKKTEWKKLFSNVSRHLDTDGVFVFDVNTEHKLENLSENPPIVHEFEDNLLVTTVSKHADKNIYNWNLRIFERKGDSDYRLFEEDLYERAFPLSRIKNMLSGKFKKIRTFDLERNKVSRKSQRVYFTAVKR